MNIRSAGAWALCLACAPLLGLLIVVAWIAYPFKRAWSLVRG